MFTLDLHTHSILSPDGGLSEREYRKLLDSKRFDVIAVTDHNEIRFAQYLQKLIGKQIIIGEEVMTKDGELIGLYLKQKIIPGLSAVETARLIRLQHGLVIVPHPFEKKRKGIQTNVLRKMVQYVDGIEVYNGRSLAPQTRREALTFADEYLFAPIVSSDAHCMLGIGKTYMEIAEFPQKHTLGDLIRHGTSHQESPPMLSYVCPKWNRLKKIIRKQL